MKFAHRKNLLELPPAFLSKMAALLGDEYDEFALKPATATHWWD